MSEPSSPNYRDSNLFLSYVERTPRRFESIEGRLVEAERGRRAIVTATVSVAEVAFASAEQMSGVLDPTIARILANLWTNPLIVLVDVTFDIALAARDLVRASMFDGPRLKPMDAIHIAAARALRASTFLTFDLALHKHSNRYGFAITAP